MAVPQSRLAVRRLYLAGPEVFRRDAGAIGAELKARCAHCGFEGVYPLEAELAIGDEALSRRIFEANLASIRACDAMIANLSPFRGPSADAGTVFELGFAVAIGKPVFAYADSSESYASRVAQRNGPLRKADGRLFASDGMSVEDFGLTDNLMIVEAVSAQGWDIVMGETRAGFEECLRRAAAYFVS
ncbi:nucleoside 2-deoxyribosyltransferase [Methylocystis parvus]|uniref:nucleoside 2-deoxyribosyltransferase n=1 Tax=Methylocystis parvus TaxID=134 RepID=UPI000685E17C|nr:nucleoside 2-deoxyribosyltransferase [Methylocystis parvus]WBK01319.1 nucleoside 2-deoxyribosyltransferase [Methylocystis parvus OBBP]